MEKQKFREILKYMLVATILVLSIKYFEVIIGFLRSLFNVVSPLILGCIIAYILNLVVQAVERVYFPNTKNELLKRSKRGVSITLSILIIIAIITLIIIVVVPQLVSTLTLLFSDVQHLVEEIQGNINTWSYDYPTLQKYIGEINLDLEGILKSTLNGIANVATDVLSSSVLVAGAVGSWIINFIIGLIFAIYLLGNKEKLAYQIKRVMKAYLSEKHIGKINTVLQVANESFSSYITGQCTEAIILGTLCALGLWIFRFPHAVMIGTFIGATALIPIVGAYLGAILGVIMMLTVSPTTAILFVVYILILQQLENNLIYPKVVGASIGLPGIWVLTAVTIGGGLGGIPGMIIGVPLVATLYKLLTMDINTRLKS